MSRGEAGGATGQVLKQVATYWSVGLRSAEGFRRLLSSNHPNCDVAGVSLVIVFVLVPSISPIFTDAGLPLPGILRTFSDLQENWLRSAVELSAGMIASAIVWQKAKRSVTTMMGLDRLKCSLPIVGKLSRRARRVALRAPLARSSVHECR